MGWWVVVGGRLRQKLVVKINKYIAEQRPHMHCKNRFQLSNGSVKKQVSESLIDLVVFQGLYVAKQHHINFKSKEVRHTLTSDTQNKPLGLL